jgi:arylsulfatase A-like enzyme
MNSLVWVVMDSCRYDSVTAAATPALDRFAAANGTVVERRYSYASWTAPSHYAFLTGLVPHSSPPGVFASEVYRRDYLRWTDRLGGGAFDFTRFIPHLSLPKVLRELGYRTVGRVSLPVLNESTAVAQHFHDYRLMDDHNDFAGMINGMTFVGDMPYFYFFNLGETHYPYMLADPDLPHVSGVHGVARTLGGGNGNDTTAPGPAAFFDNPAILDRLRRQQVRCVEYIDGLLPRLFATCPPGTHLIITADHGELFGEDGYFGHGPVMHPKVFEVPFVEGKVPQD